MSKLDASQVAEPVKAVKSAAQKRKAENVKREDSIAQTKTAAANGKEYYDGDKKKRKKSKFDQSAGLMRTGAISVTYASVMYTVLRKFPATGLHFHSEAWMQSLVSFEAVYITPLLYCVAVFAACRLMRNLPAQHALLRNYVQPVYNVVQIVVCSYMVWGLWPTVQIANRNPFGMQAKRSKSVEWFVFVHYLTKYLDWCDTFFMIAKKNFQQVSFLQVFHHATIGMIWGALLSVGWGSGTVAYGAFINSVTHIIMYTHYFIKSFGIENPFKAWVTRFQLAQFFSCIVHAVLVWQDEKIYPRDLSYIQIMYHPIMIFLFGFNIKWAPRWLNGGIEAA